MPEISNNSSSTWKLYPLVAGGFGPVAEVHMFRNGLPDRSNDVPSLIYLLAKENDFVLVDTSFRDPVQVNRELGIKCERKTEICDLLAVHGVKADQVGLVIFTHLHWDHAASNHLFPKAHFLCQREELHWLFSPPAWELGYEEWFVEEVFKIRGRLRTVDGDSSIKDGIEVWHVGGHTAGSQAVAVNTAQGIVVITGDTVMSYDNVEKQIPIGLFHNMKDCVRFIDKLNKEKVIFIPSHDWRVLERYHVDE